MGTAWGLLGVQPGTTRPELNPAAPIPTAPAISTAGGPAELLRRRPDIIAAERTLAASNAASASLPRNITQNSR